MGGLVFEEKSANETTFVNARFHITKCHELADYVCDEEQYIIKAIEKRNMEEFKEYLGEILSNSKCCQKDLRKQIDFINAEQMVFIIETQRMIEKR